MSITLKPLPPFLPKILKTVRHSKIYERLKDKPITLGNSTLHFLTTLHTAPPKNRIAFTEKHMITHQRKTGYIYKLLSIANSTLLERYYNTDKRIATYLRAQNLFLNSTRTIRQALLKYWLPSYYSQEFRNYQKIAPPYVIFAKSIQEDYKINFRYKAKLLTSFHYVMDLLMAYYHTAKGRRNKGPRRLYPELIANTPLEAIPTWLLEKHLIPLLNKRIHDHKEITKLTNYDAYVPYMILKHYHIQNMYIAFARVYYHNPKLFIEMLKYLLYYGLSLEMASFYLFLKHDRHVLPVHAPYAYELLPIHRNKILRTFIASILYPLPLHTTIIPDYKDQLTIYKDWIKIAPPTLRQMEINYLRLLAPSLYDFYNWYATLLMPISYKYVFNREFTKTQLETKTWMPFINITNRLSTKEIKLLLSSKGIDLATEIYQSFIQQ